MTNVKVSLHIGNKYNLQTLKNRKMVKKLLRVGAKLPLDARTPKAVI